MAGTTIDISVDLGGILADVIEKADANARIAMGGAILSMSNEARSLAPVGSTGILAQSIRPGTVTGSLRGGDLSGYLSATAPHAEAQEFGSGTHGPSGKAYPIFPRFKRALRFPVAGSIEGGEAGFGFARKVMHPGVRPQRFLQRGVEAKLDMLSSELTAAIVDAVEGG